MWRSPSSPQIHQKYNYMWNNSYRTPTERWQKTSDLPKGKKLPTYLVGQKKKEKTETRIGTGPAPVGGLVNEGGEASEPRRRAQQQGCCCCGGQSRERFQRIGADQHSPAREACLLTHRGGRGLGAETPASEVGSQGEDWGWLREHSLKGASAPQLAGRESGKKSAPVWAARDHCFAVHEETGLRAPLKGAPETGASRGYQRVPQRWAWNAKTAAAATKKPVCQHRSLSTPPLPRVSSPALLICLFKIVVIGVRQYPIVVLIYISLMIDDAKHLCLCLLAICIYSLNKYIFMPFAHFFSWTVYLFVIECWEIFMYPRF